jgi:hypothetical protein
VTALIVITAVAEVPFAAAITVTTVALVTVLAATAKAAVLPPVATVTATGVVTAALLVDRAITKPAAGALPVRVTVHVPAVPASRADGAQDNERTVTVSARSIDAVLLIPFNEAVTVTVCALATVPAVALKLPAVAPAAIATDAGTARIALLSDKETKLPPAGAALLNVTVHVAVPVDVRLVGAQSRDDTWATPPRLIEVLFEMEP